MANSAKQFVEDYKLQYTSSDTPLESPETAIEGSSPTISAEDEVNNWNVDIERGTALDKEPSNVEKVGTFLSQSWDQVVENYGEYDRAKKGILEATDAVITGAAGSIIGGTLGFGTDIAQRTKNVFGMEMTEDDIRKYDPIKVISTVQEALTYQPKTEVGITLTDAIATPGEWWHENFAKTIGDIGYAVSDYVGGHISEDIFNSDRTAKDVKNEFVSTTGGTLTAVADIAMPLYIIKGIKKIPKPKTSMKGIIDKTQTNAIDEYIYKEFDSLNQLKERHNELINLEKKIPGYDAGVVELTESTGIAGVQRDLANKSPVRKYENATRIKQNRNAIIKFINDEIGPVFENDKVVLSDMEKVLRESKGSVDAAIDYLIKKYENGLNSQVALTKKLGNRDSVEAATKLRSIMARNYLIAKKIGDIKYKKVGNPTVNADPFIEEFYKASQDPQFKALVDVNSPAVPSIYYEIKGKIKDSVQKASVVDEAGKTNKIMPAELDFEQLREWDQQLSKKIRMLERQQDVGRELYFSRKMQNNVRSSMDSLAGKDAATTEAYNDARAYWGKNVVNKYETGIVGEILRTDIKGKNGVYKVIDEKIIDTIFNKGTKTAGGARAIDEFLKVFGDHPVAMKQLKEGVYSKLQKYADPGNTGILDPRKVDRFIEDNKSILDSLPEWKKDFTEINRISHGLAVSTKRANLAKQALENRQLVKALNGENPFKMIDAALKSPESMRELMVRLSNDKYAQKALPRAVSHYVLGKAVIKDNRGIWHIDHEKARKILDNPDYSKSFDMVFGKEHRKNLNTIIKAWETQAPYRRLSDEKIKPTGASIEQQFEERMGTSLKSMMGDVRLIGVRHVPPQYIVGGWTIRKISAFRQAILEENIAKSFFDKDLSQVVNDVIEMEKSAKARAETTKADALKDIKHMKEIEKRLRKNMIKTGEWGFDPKIANAQAIANTGRIDDLTSEEDYPSELVVQ